MKRIGLWISFLLAVLAPASAQVTVEVSLDQDQFLPGEAIIAAVRITNRSGQTLRLGTDVDWLTFSIESRDREVVPKSGEAPVTGEFLLASSKVATKRADLAPYFSASVPGGYSVNATVQIKEWNRVITSEPRKFNIIEGSKLWEQEIGLPQTAGATNSPPEVRKYILQQARYLKTQLRLYLRLTDASGSKVFRVFPVGSMVSFGQPEPQVDRFSNLHLLYQDKPHAFNYTVFNPDGQVVVHQTYDYINTRPRLHPEGDGRITVTGGTRRFTPGDLPEIKGSTADDDKPLAPVPPVEIKPPKP
ncbi:MAG: hypothetical protein WCL11_17280 [Verrucomicrobiota bacterium]